MSKAPPGSTTSGAIPAPQKGFLAPDFTLTTAQGGEIALSSLRGRPVLINLWASWCPPCRAEMPAIQKVYEEYASQGFVVLAVNTAYQDDQAKALEFAEELGLTFPILWDLDGTTSNQYHLRALPTSFFIDANGIVQEVVVGGPMSEALLRVRVQQLFEVDR